MRRQGGVVVQQWRRSVSSGPKASRSGPSTTSLSPQLPSQSDRLPPPRPQKWVEDALKAGHSQAGPSSEGSHSGQAVFQEIRENLKNRNFSTDEEAFSQYGRWLERRTEVSRQLKTTRASMEKNAADFHAHRKSSKGKEKATSDVEDEGEKLQSEARVLRTTRRELEKSFEELSDNMNQVSLGLPNRSHEASPIGPEHNALVKALHRGKGRASGIPGRFDLRRVLEDKQKTGILSEDFPRVFEDDALFEKSKSEDDHIGIASSLLGKDDPLGLDAGRLASVTSNPFLVGHLARLETALLGLAAHTAAASGFTPVSPPIMVRTDIAERCGFRPRGGQGGQTYFVTSSSDLGEASPVSREGAVGETRTISTSTDLCLVGTAEISLGALVAGRKLSLSKYPDEQLKLFAISPCFRAEAGSRGLDTKGLYRLHQFQKAEMFVVTKNGNRTLHHLLGIQMAFLDQLNLTYRVLEMPTEELGASAARKYDIECWMPGRGSWGEVTSASDCSDFQTSRLHISNADERDSKAALQTCNATLCAVPRLIIALLEQYGLDDDRKRMVLPTSLKPFWFGDSQEVSWVEESDGGLDNDTWLADGLQTDLSSSRSSTSASSSTDPSNPQSKATASQPVPPPRTLFYTLRSRLSSLSARTGSDLPSLTASFLLLHEITAVAPLLLLFYLFGSLGVGEAICEFFVESADDDDDDKKGDVSDKGNQGMMQLWRGVAAQWVQEGLKRGERLVQKYKPQVEGAAPEGETGPAPPDAPVIEGQKIAGALANAVAAYLVTKVLLVPRLFLSFYLSPVVARTVFVPAHRFLGRLFKKSKGGR